LCKNVTSFSTKTRVVEVFVEQLLDLMQRPCRITIYQPLRVRGRTGQILIRRIAAGLQASGWLRCSDQASRFDPALDFPGDEQVVLIEKGFANLKLKGGKWNIDSTAGQGKLQRSGRVAELPASNPKGVQVLVTPAVSDLQRSVQLAQRRLFGDMNPACHWRRLATQPRIQLQRADLLFVSHRLNLALAAIDFKTPRSAPGTDRSLTCTRIMARHYLPLGAPRWAPSML
jgi:hypothetical protein